MAKIVYYVATSLDGFIAGLDGDISDFSPGGEAVDKYLADLQEYRTVIMGRKTYEFGYRFGLVPGQPAYPHMEHFIFSDTLKLDNPSHQVHVVPRSLDRVHEIKENADTDIYLCGGGEFAGWLLDRAMIDQLKIKLNPIVLTQGVRLFGDSTSKAKWSLNQTEVFDDGITILTYDYLGE